MILRVSFFTFDEQVEAEVLDKLDNLLQAGWGDDEYKEAFADM